MFVGNSGEVSAFVIIKEKGIQGILWEYFLIILQFFPILSVRDRLYFQMSRRWITVEI